MKPEEPVPADVGRIEQSDDLFVKPESASALFAGPFALATLSEPDGTRFPALVTGGERTPHPGTGTGAGTAGRWILTP